MYFGYVDQWLRHAIAACLQCTQNLESTHLSDSEGYGLMWSLLRRRFSEAGWWEFCSSKFCIWCIVRLLQKKVAFWIRTQMVDHHLEIIYKAGGWWWWCRKKAGGMDFVVQKLAMELLESGMRLLTVPGIECNSRKHSCMLSISSDCLTVKNTDRIACAASCHPRLQRKAPAQAPPLLCKKTKQTVSASFSSASCSTILIRKKSGKEGWAGTRSWRNLQEWAFSNILTLFENSGCDQAATLGVRELHNKTIARKERCQLCCSCVFHHGIAALSLLLTTTL